MLQNKSVYKYKTLYTGTFSLIHMWTNATVTLQMGPMVIIYNIHQIKTYKSKTYVYDVHIEFPVIYIRMYIYIYLLKVIIIVML